MDILEDKIITRFGVPSKIITEMQKPFAQQRCPLFVSNMELSYHMHQIVIPKEMVKNNQAIKI
jgi:hypothetical protein